MSCPDIYKKKNILFHWFLKRKIRTNIVKDQLFGIEELGWNVECVNILLKEF